MKKIIAYTILFVFAIAPNSYAQTAVQTTVNVAPSTVGPSKTTESPRVAKLKGRAIAEIDRRLTALNRLNTRIALFKKLTSTQKKSLTDKVAAEITSLSALRTKVLAETEITLIKEDTASIVKSYRVFALFIPQIHLLGGVDSTSLIASQLMDYAGKLDIRVAEAKAKGQNVTAYETSLLSIKTVISDASEESTAILELLEPLAPEGFPANKSILQSARTKLNTVRVSLKKAHADLEKIRAGVKAESIKETVSGVPSSITPTQKVTPTTSSL